MPVQQPLEAFFQLSVPAQATVFVFILVLVQQLRQGYIGRVGIASAGVLIFGKGYPIWNQLDEMWKLYVATATFFAVIASFSYLTKESLSSEFYKIAYILFGAVPVIMILLYGFPL